MEYLKDEKKRTKTPNLEGSFKSKVLNLDELIDWDDTTSAPTPINLPDLTSSIQADIQKMIATGVTMNNLNAKAGTTPNQIKLDEAKIELFGGKADGSFVWDVPQPDHTKISFKGSLDSLQTKSFFEAYPILGKDSEFHKYISGAFSADINYSSELDSYLQPIMKTADMDGTLGMTKSRLQGYPVQEKVASFLKSNELKNIVLDKWQSAYTLDNNIFTIENMRLTSGDIGLEMNGTQNFANENIDYQMKILLPPKFKNAIASVITKQAADALTQNNGTIMAPLRITGTTKSPNINPDKEVIAPIVKDYLKGKAGDVLKGLFGN